GVAEVEEVPRVVPGEALALHGTAVAAELRFRLAEQEVRFAHPPREGEAADSAAEDEVFDPRSCHRSPDPREASHDPRRPVIRKTADRHELLPGEHAHALAFGGGGAEHLVTS